MKGWLSLLIYVGIAAVIHALRDFTLMMPIDAWLVAVHETGHAAMALLTGGSVDHIQVNLKDGHAITRGGWTPLIFAGGYLGNACWGCAFVSPILSWPLGRRTAGLAGSLYHYLFGLVEPTVVLSSCYL